MIIHEQDDLQLSLRTVFEDVETEFRKLHESFDARDKNLVRISCLTKELAHGTRDMRLTAKAQIGELIAMTARRERPPGSMHL